jgi:tetratricopeptide (TPR) repeat protein
MMENTSDALSLARDLDLSAEEDAAEFVRHQALRSVRSFEELQQMMRVLRTDEPEIRDELEKALEKEKDANKGLELCRKFLRLAPHNTYARRRLLALLEVLDMKEQIVSSVRTWRSEPVADAGLLAEGASALLRLGKKDEGRRAFGELIERAPRDPWTLAFVGDRLRAEGLFDEAGAAYDTLARMMPHEGAVILRQALAHAGAGRIDVASRLFDRVSQTGGRHDEGRLADLATIAEAALLSAARGGDDAEVEAEIERRLLRTPLPDAKALVLVRAAPSDEPVTLEITRDEGETLAQSAEMDARHLGLVAARVERGERGAIKLALRRGKIAGPSHPVEATVSVLLLGKPGELPQLSSKTVRVAADGEPLRIELQEGRLL